MLKIVGLGAGDISQLPIGVGELLKEDNEIYLRTDHHPMMNYFKENHIAYTSFDAIYERFDTFEEVYQEIITTLRTLSKDRDIIYAVPGHPCVAEYTVKTLMQDENVEVVGGQSFFDAMFASLKIDPIDGLLVMDAQDIKTNLLSDQINLIIPQVYDQLSASNVKLDLMEVYPDEYMVCIVRAAGSCEELKRWLPLFEIDHDFPVDNLTTLFVPALSSI
ncbi:MAG: SAM-dependent methyltransferase [Erysipelotrichaceae bacterium]